MIPGPPAHPDGHRTPGRPPRRTAPPAEPQLFGALPGAHSTATRRIEGKVESAERGTLFLDEIGELSPAAQAKLLHLLHAKEYYPLGSTQPLRANLRVIAATNTDLQQAVAEHRFREDLPLLAAHFCVQACARHCLPRLALSPNALRAAEAAEWPGNIRQLENAVEAAAIRAAGEHAKQVERVHLFPESVAATEPEAAATFQEAPAASRPASCTMPWRRRAGTWSTRRGASTSRARTSTIT